LSFFTPEIFLRPELLFGAALAIIPILLHLLMRSKPKKLLFPALRLIQQRKKNNVRRLQLRHLWLLILRILVIVLIVLAIARPSLPAANYSLTGTETLALIGIVLLAAGAYFGLMTRWKKARLPHHAFIYRRSLLRGGTGVMIVLLLLLLVFWPYQKRIAAEIEAPAAELTEDLPIAAVFLFDTSLSMDYRHEGQTRLEQAQDIAVEYLSQLPTASRVAVGGTANDEPFSFREDLIVARGDVESLKTSAVSVPLDQRVREALRAQEQDLGRTLESQASIPEESRQDQFLREIYIFTDLSQTAWKKSAVKLLKEELERLKFVNIYVIDLSIENPQNVVVESLTLSSQSIPVGTPLSVDVTLSATGQEEVQQTVEIIATNASGEEVVQGKRSVTLQPGEKVQESFQLSDLAQPFAQGEVRLVGGDPLNADNRRFFTVGTQLPPRILIVSGEEGEGEYLKAPLAPVEFEKLGRAPFRVDQKTGAWLKGNVKELPNYRVVCLVNVPAPTDDVWNALANYTNKGGGLAIFLDGNVNAAAYNTPTAQTLVPAFLEAKRKFDPPEFFSVTAKDHATHPVFKRLSDSEEGVVLFSKRPVFECWKVARGKDAAVPVWFTQMNYPAPTPAILERQHGVGRVVLITTGVTLKTGEPSWSMLAHPGYGWDFLLFSHDLMNYLSRQAAAKFNYPAGQEARLRLDREKAMESYLFRTPDGAQQSRSVPEDVSELTLVDTDQVGHYRVLDADPDSDFAVGFSVNAPAEESDLTRLKSEDLTEMFGENRYRISRSLEELERIVTEGRLGQELFPQVLVLVLVFFCAEHLVSNRFYEADQQPSEGAKGQSGKGAK
jgi:hypothetical protein